MSTNKEFNNVQLDVKFTRASTRENLVSEENISVSFGKISKYFADLHSQAFTGYTHPSHTAYSSGLYKVTVDGLGHVTAASTVTGSDLPAHEHPYLPLAGGTLTGRVTTTKFLNYIVKGTGTAGADKGSGQNPRYVPAKWTFNTGQTASDGDVIFIKIPVAGHDYGVYISIDNGTTYHPVVTTGSSRLTTHYANGNYAVFTFRSDGSAASMIPLAGNTDGTRVTVTGGVWQGIDYYDSGNTYDRTSQQTRIYAGGVGVFRYSICGLNSAQRMESFTTTGDASGSPTTTKTFNTSAKFSYPPVIMYNSANAVYANGNAIGNNVLYEQYPSIDMRYSCNKTSSASTGFAQYKPVFIECTFDDNGFWSITSNGFVQTFTSGNYYILVGCMYSTSVYQLAIFAQHPVYYYDGTNLTMVPFTKAEKTKLAGISEGANKTEASTNGKIKIDGTDTTVYTHPTYTSKTSGLYKITVDSTGHVSAATTVTKTDIPALDYLPNTTKYALSDSVGGSAKTADKLTTARTINVGTGVDGTATSFDGSTDITIPVTGIKEAYLTWGGKDFTGSYSPFDAALEPRLGANRLEMCFAAGIKIERTTDGGTTWTVVSTSTISNSVRRALLSSTGGGQVSVSAASTAGMGTDAAKYMMRVTLDTSAAGVYTELRKFIINVSTNGSTGSYVKIRIRTQANVASGTDTWLTWDKTNRQWSSSPTEANSRAAISGWSGFNVLNVPPFVTYGNQTSHYRNIQFIFGCTSNTSEYSGLSILNIQGYGGVGWTTPSNMAKTGHLYSWTGDGDASFPSSVTATNFNGKLNTMTISGTTNASYDLNAFLTEHPTIPTSTDTTSTPPALSNGGTFEAIDSVTRDLNGHVTKVNTVTYTLPSYSFTDTKVDQTLSSADEKHPLLIANPQTNNTTATVNGSAFRSNSIYATPSTGAITASKIYGSGTEGQSTAPTGGYHIYDCRNIDITPAHGDRAANFYFHMTGTPDTGKWWSILHMRGWTGAYSAWEVAGPSHNSDQRTTPLYVRTSNGINAWGSWRKIYDSSNKPTASDLGFGTIVTHNEGDYVLKTNAGSMLNPVYFPDGTPTASSGNTIPFITGTGSTAGTWLGALEGLTEYYDGLLILYKPSVAGASTTTLNINNLGAKTCYVNNTTKLTTHFPANQPILLVYSTSQNSGCWMCLDDYWTDSNTYDRNRYTGTIKAGTTALVAGNIIVGKDGVYNHLKSGGVFDISYPILYNNGAVNASATTTNTYDIIHFTVTTTQSISLTAYLPVFIKGTLSGTTFTPVSTTPLTQTVPTTDDGYAYIYLGNASAATTIYLQERHPIYAYKNGAFGEIVHTASNVNGYTVEKNVPSNAVFTDVSVTSVGNHYAPAEDSSAVISKDASSTTAATWNSTSLVTGIDVKRDAKGHVVDIALDSIKMPANPVPSNNITGSGTSGYLAKFNGTNTITNGPQLGSSTTTFLRNDGTWATPTDTDTKVNVTLATTTKAYLLGTSTTPTTTAQAVTSVADTGVYLDTTAGGLCATNVKASSTVCANTGNSSTAGGISLYSSDPETYGIMFRGTSNSGKHGYVQSDWATYFTMNQGATTRGWIFRKKTDGPVASISGAGNAVFNGSVTVGGNSANTSGCRMTYNSTTQTMDFVFA